MLAALLCIPSVRLVAADVPGWKPSPTGAALRSLVLPGWGQLYNRAPFKAVVVSGVETGLLYGMYHQHRLMIHYDRLEDADRADLRRNQRNRLTWLFAGTLILSVMDAYVDAHLYGFEVSPVPAFKPGGGVGLSVILGISEW